MNFIPCSHCGHDFAPITDAQTRCSACSRAEDRRKLPRRQEDYSLLAMQKESLEILRDLKDRTDYGAKLVKLVREVSKVTVVLNEDTRMNLVNTAWIKSTLENALKEAQE